MKNGNDDLYFGGQKSLSRLLGLVNSTRLVPRIEMDDDPPEAGDWVGFRRKVKEGGEIVAAETARNSGEGPSGGPQVEVELCRLKNRSEQFVFGDDAPRVTHEKEEEFERFARS